MIDGKRYEGRESDRNERRWREGGGEVDKENDEGRDRKKGLRERGSCGVGGYDRESMREGMEIK